LDQTKKDNFGIVTPDAITGLARFDFSEASSSSIAVPLMHGRRAIVSMYIMTRIGGTERTKEIGIRKSLGARKIDILKQFLVES
jgi:putative ABC transport system permease protein